MSPRPELSKPMTSVTAAASTSRKLTRTTTSPSHWLNAERGNPMRNERAADESGLSTLAALLSPEPAALGFTLVVEARSLGYRRSSLFPPPQHAVGVLPGAEGRIVVERPPELGEKGVVVDVAGRQFRVVGDRRRYRQLFPTLACLSGGLGVQLGQPGARLLWFPFRRHRRQVDGWAGVLLGLGFRCEWRLGLGARRVVVRTRRVNGVGTDDRDIVEHHDVGVVVVAVGDRLVEDGAAVVG